MDDSSQDSPSELRQSSQPGTTNHHRSTPMQSMKEITNIPVLSRPSNEYKIKTIFLRQTQEMELLHLETRTLQRKHQEVLPKNIKPIAFTLNDPPCEDKLGNVTIQTSVTNITTKAEKTSIVKKALTMSMLEDKYPSESWVIVYIDGSATNTTTKGGAGIYIQYPHGEQQSEAIPTGLHRSNYKAEGEAIMHAAHTIKCKVDNNTQVVFLTDALSVLQALMNDNLP